ncbi:TonB-dependent receptor [Elizabethkingia argentiflava]|uniref:TonB-dependent receptor n=1 Tax=Elizabethkingia argenteiflava TaxID=2681556 RepID=A0A845PVM5_9FLAO|nr:TonB-dependent receptor [Elizabethkingia argenteiflava]NAW52279.1 TonB-dependent receptor [Elizabethkingia argenteiflava]
MIKSTVSLLALMGALMLEGQQLKDREIEEVVISASTFEQKAKEVPIPIKIIEKKQIQQSGSVRLSDILAEQTGLVIIPNHGAGVQVQGMTGEYSLILINGQPLVGRTAGTLDLSRITVHNIKRIEIIKGPSSALYGSDALAGVINIITETPLRDASDLNVRYGSYTTVDIGGGINIHRKKISLNLSANRYSSAGYKLNPDADQYGQTVNPFENYTYSTNINFKPNSHWELGLYTRYYYENLGGKMLIQGGKVDGYSKNQDYNIIPQATWRPNDKVTSRLGLYMSASNNDSQYKFVNSGQLVDETFFREHYNKVESFTDIRWNKRWKSTLGMGIVQQQIEASRYNNKKTSHQLYALGQLAYTPMKSWKILAGFRYDDNSIFGPQFNPKLATEIGVSKFLNLQASIGRGFKAPDFRQLYLNFTNSLIGYSVLGTQEVALQLEKMQKQGLIAQILVSPSKIGVLEPESSWSYNVGANMTPIRGTTLKVNAFRNDIQNLIQTLPIARKNNGQNVFSYQNFAKVFTQGVETELWVKLSRSFTLVGGYQYLEAKDKDIQNRIKAGEVFGINDHGNVIRLKSRDYFGIQGRSKHSFNAKLFYEDKKGWFFNIRGLYRGQYGFADKDGNGIINNKSELAPSYFILNTVLGKKIATHYHLSIGSDNLLNFKNIQYNPEYAGRILWINFKIIY